MNAGLSTPELAIRESHAICDVAIAALRGSVIELRECVANLEADLDAYRAVAQQAIHSLHDLTKECDRLRDQNSELRNELHRLRHPDRRAR